MKEELNRLQSAQDDAQRSLEILEFMASKMDNDPLVNPSTNNQNMNFLLSNNNNNNLYLLNDHSSGDDGNNDDTEISPNLEYLPSNTIIRLANKQVKKICDLRIGDKILSLCINSYPTNGKSRDSFLPAPSKRPSQQIQNGIYNNNIKNKNKHNKHNNKTLQRSSVQQHRNKMGPKQKSLSGLPRRPRSRTQQITVPFMLPPPVQRPLSASNANSNQLKAKESTQQIDLTYDDNELPHLSQRYHTKKGI